MEKHAPGELQKCSGFETVIELHVQGYLLSFMLDCLCGKQLRPIAIVSFP